MTSPPENAVQPLRLVVMGVSGAGKTTVGAELANALGAIFVDGDVLHPASNIDKMSAGLPLTDEDRAPWLAEIGRRFAAAHVSIVIGCSALKRGYRDCIRTEAGASVLFLHLAGSDDLLRQRLEARTGHFMPADLLDSQLATLEPLASDEAGLTLGVDRPVSELINAACAWLDRL